jgi:hypothetical protein
LIGRGIEFVVLTEDQNKKLVSLLFEANGGIKGKFQVWAYKGCSKLDIAEALGKFIHEVSPQTKIIVHRDSDYLSDGDKAYWKQQFERYQLDVFFPPTPDVEGVLCRLEHLKALNPAHLQEVEDAFNHALMGLQAEFRSSARKGRETVDDLRHKQGQPTEGKVAIQAWSEQLDLNLERWRHGKKLLAAIRNRFQETIGTNLKTESMSQHLVVPELQAWVASARRQVVAQAHVAPQIAATPVTIEIPPIVAQPPIAIPPAVSEGQATAPEPLASENPRHADAST